MSASPWSAMSELNTNTDAATFDTACATRPLRPGTCRFADVLQGWLEELPGLFAGG